MTTPPDVPEQTPGKGFQKHDQGKARFDLLPPVALEEIAHVFGHGAEKYGADNWRFGAAWSRYFAAAMRHLWAYWRGEDLDPETGRHHLAHAACCALILLACARGKIGTDDRRTE